MFPIGEGRLRIGVLGAETVERQLSEGGDAVTRPITVESVPSELPVDPDGLDGPLHCVVVECPTQETDRTDVVQRFAEVRPELPVVALTDAATDGAVAEALEAGAAEALPAALPETDPELLADRIVSVVERERALSGIRELYDGAPGGMSLHDPETGELLDANLGLRDRLGYSRDELRSLSLDALTAEVSGYDGERARNAVRSASRQEEPMEFEWPFEAADGSVSWSESTVETATFGSRELVRWSSVDVTGARRTEHTYEEVFDNVNDVITVHDPWAGEVVDVNETLCALTGYSRDALLEMGLDGLSATEEGFTADRAYEIQQRVATRDEPETVDWVIETASGERRRLETKLSPATIAGEDRVLVLARDVTERSQLERTYRQLFESVSDGLVVHDPDTGEILDVNDRYCTLTGYDREELLGSNVRLVVSEEAEYTEAVALDRIDRARTEGPQLFEFEGERKDGERFVGEIHLSTVDVRGDERVLASVRDVTERKRREREYERIFDGVQDAILVMDPDTLEILDANEAYLDLVGYDDIETIREAGVEGLSATTEGYTFEEGREIHRRVADTGEPEVVEWGAETRDGERRWLEIKVAPAVIGGEDVNIAIHRDVTERKRRERVIRALHESTDSLQEAETPREVCEAAIETATDVLELSVPTCWLADPDGPDALVPITGGGSTRGSGGHEWVPSEFEPGAFEYDVYETGDAWVGDSAELSDDAPPGDAVLVPMGTHGLFAAVDGFDDVTFDAVRILVRHVTAALDRVERARELHESERRFQLIAEHIDEIVYLSTADFSEILYINPAYEDITGQSVSELDESPTAFVEAAHPDDRARYRADIERLIEDVEAGDPQEAYGGQYRIERDGEVRWITVTRFPVENEDGTVDRIVGRVQDVTERKRREREYEQIFDGVTDAITVHDPETGELIDLNETMCELTGYDRDELLAAGQEAINVAEEGYSSERARRTVREVMETGEERTLEWLIERRDGQRRWLEVKASPTTLNGEERHLAIMRDVTKQRRTERRLGAILDRIDEAIFMTRAEELVDPSGSPDYVSSGYDAIWNRTLEEIQESQEAGFFDTLHPDDRADYRAFVEGIVAEMDDGTAADSYSHEYRIRRPDGEERWVRSDYYPTEWPIGAPRIVVLSRDVTDRKDHERRIASFDDATDDLATADSPEEATRTAVEAATETLELPAVAAFLYDDDDGVLRPEVTAGSLPTAVAAEPVSPGDGLLWEGFATGTVVASDGGESEPGFVGEGDVDPRAVDELADWRALALGNHGVLLVGSPERSLDSETIRTAHVLAATLEAALNHLRGQRRLEAQEEALRTQTERADRLDRIARLTQQVEAAITEASSAGEVEQAVCDRLADSGPYELAWLGSVDAGSNRLTAHAVAGATGHYVEKLDLRTTAETADPHPAVDAYRSDEVRLADSLVGTGPTDDWRRDALSEGYQSLCAVPLTYDGISHGVLTLGMDSPNAFDERERDVLAQLGVSIGNALAGIERRRALESDETVELEFRGPGDALSFTRAAEEAGCRISLERTVARQDGLVSVFFSFEGEVPEDAVEIANRTLPGTVDVVSDGSSSTLVEVRTDDWFGSPLAEYGGVLRQASALPEETVITVEVPQQADVRSFVERLATIAPSLELVARRQHRRREQSPAELNDRIRSQLTDRQYEALRTALSAGYFEWPRENDGGDVAERLDITQPTLNKHLRLAEKKTFSLLFE